MEGVGHLKNVRGCVREHRDAPLADTTLVDASGLWSARFGDLPLPSGSVHLAPECDGLAIPSAGRYR